MSKRSKQLSFFIFILGILVFTFAFTREHDPIKHKVSVNRMIIPVFAFDTGGSPVYDLKKDDLELYINGKPVGIDTFHRIRFAYDWETIRKAAGEKIKEVPAVLQGRIIFLIVDTMFNSFYGLNNAKKISEALIDSDSVSTGSHFVVMQVSMFGGLKLIGGPEKNKKKLKTFIRAITRLPERNPTGNASGRDRNNMISAVERRNQREKMKVFIDYLSRLKYSLEGIDQAKLVFLISEGIPEILFYDDYIGGRYQATLDSSQFSALKELVKEINDSGGLLYTIYPGRLKLNLGVPADPSEDGITLANVDIPLNKESGIESLKTIAVGSGARFFEGVTERITREVHKSTAAYYELVFSPRPEFGEEMHINIKCNRERVNVDSLISTVKSKAYAHMKRIQKKVFAISTVMGRNWVNMPGGMEQAVFRWYSSERDAIEVKIPENMKRRAVDIFLIQFDRGFRDADITMVSKKVTDTEIIKIRKKKDKNVLYFLIIEPESTYCIYNRVNRI
jgi:hypothetical protein